MLMLPESEEFASAFADAPASLRHNDQEANIPFRPLSPYTYPGELPTTCFVRGRPHRHITFLANRSRAQVTVNLERVCPHGLTNDGVCDGANGSPDPSPMLPSARLRGTAAADSAEVHKVGRSANPMTKILLGTHTIVYVVEGAIRTSVGGVDGTFTLPAGTTLVCERKEDSPPTDLTIVPLLATPDGKTAADAEGTGQVGHQDATLFIIQVHLKKLERKDSMSSTSSSATSSLSLLPASNTYIRPARGRTGSIIVYDDQPIRTLPREFDSQLQLEGLPPLVKTASTATTAALPLQQWEPTRHYRPPVFSARHQNESEVPPPIVRDRLNVEEFPTGRISTAWINMVKQGLSEWLRIPVGITAVVHGNELNGVPCIHRVITDIDVHRLAGTVVAVPCVNVPGYLRFAREFSDGKDLNRMFPGKPEGTASQIYAFNLMDKVIGGFHHLIDLHTASFGRVNSYYVRSDLNDPVAAAMAKLQQPQIILHNSGQDGTLRSAAAAKGIKAITVEIGNPQLFQNQYVQWSYTGVMRILAYLDMFSGGLPTSPTDETGADTASQQPPHPGAVASPPNTVICSRGFWIYTRTGGVLEVYPNINTVVRKGALVARIKNIFGNIVDEIYCPAHGIV
ncbi:hypothetical protein HK405_012031, partial [Cladochytrium tenue]